MIASVVIAAACTLRETANIMPECGLRGLLRDDCCSADCATLYVERDCDCDAGVRATGRLL